MLPVRAMTKRREAVKTNIHTEKLVYGQYQYTMIFLTMMMRVTFSPTILIWLSSVFLCGKVCKLHASDCSYALSSSHNYDARRPKNNGMNS